MNAKSTPSSKVKGVSLKVVVFLTTLTAAIIPLGLYGYISYQDTTKQVMESTNNRLLSSNQSGSKIVKTWVEGNDAAIRAAATSPDVIALEPDRSRASLVKTGEQLKNFYAIMNIDKTGQQIARSNVDKMINVGDREYFKKPFEGSPSYIQSAISRTNGKAFLAFAAPLRKEAEIVGVLAGLANIDVAAEQVTGGRIGKSGISYLVDSSNGLILAHHDAKLVGTKIEGEGTRKYKSSVFGKIEDGIGLSKQPVKFTASQVGTNMVLVSEIDSVEIVEPIKAAQQSALLFILAAFLMSGGLSFVLARSISVKIEKLAEVVTGISKAKGALEIAALEKQIDEVGGARELQSIAQAIRRLSTSIKLAMRA